MHIPPEPFQAIAISRLAHALKAEGRSILHMEFGQPSTGAPRAAVAAAHQVLDSDGMGYWESAPLKARLVRLYRERYGVSIGAGQIILTCGASPALVLALSSNFRPGERVAMARPGYVAYRNTLRALHMVPQEIGCGAETRFQLTAAHLAALDPAPAGVIIASPGNPTGTIIPAGEMAAIAALCAERGIRMLSDEIYHGLSYGAPTHSMLEFAPDAMVISSFSKYFSMAGWRLGWLVVPSGRVELTSAYAGNMFLTPPSLSQHAALVAMDCTQELDSHVAVYAENRRQLLAVLPALGLGAIAPPDGAFYVYADVGHLTGDSVGFCRRMLEETGVAIAPGVDFDPVEGRHFIRMSFAVSTAEVHEAIARLVPWFAKMGR